MSEEAHACGLAHIQVQAATFEWPASIQWHHRMRLLGGQPSFPFTCRGGAIAGVCPHVQLVAANGDGHAAAAHADGVRDGEGARCNLLSAQLLPVHDGGAWAAGENRAEGRQPVGQGHVAGVSRQREGAGQAAEAAGEDDRGWGGGVTCGS